MPPPLWFTQAKALFVLKLITSSRKMCYQIISRKIQFLWRRWKRPPLLTLHLLWLHTWTSRKASCRPICQVHSRSKMLCWITLQLVTGILQTSWTPRSPCHSLERTPWFSSMPCFSTDSPSCCIPLACALAQAADVLWVESHHFQIGVSVIRRKWFSVSLWASELTIICKIKK